MSRGVNRRWEVFDRDEGFCALCGADAEKVARVLARLEDGFRKAVRPEHAEACRDAWLLVQKQWELINQRAIDFGMRADPSTGWWTNTLWHADHIRPIADGGDNTLENQRTLCWPCHRQETKRYASWLFKGRKKGKARVRALAGTYSRESFPYKEKASE